MTSNLSFMTYLILYFSCSFLFADSNAGDNFFWTKFILGSRVMFITYQAMLIPEKRRQKYYKKMLASLTPGDTVLTTGGIVGEIETLSDQFVTLKFPSGYSLVIIKDSITGIISAEKFNGTKEL